MIAGQRVRRVVPGRDRCWCCRCSIGGEVVGALAVTSPSRRPATPMPMSRVFWPVLANNAAIAMENARLYEQEKESVRRLRELDTMKTDFLSTVQHELRTPLTAILGLSDLIEMCWEIWEDSPKLDALRDIQVAARNLDGIVETIIDFSVGRRRGADPGSDRRAPRSTRSHAPSTSIGERHKGGLPIPRGGRGGSRRHACTRTRTGSVRCSARSSTTR